MAQGEKVNPKAALFTPQLSSDLSQIARLSPDDPKTIGAAVFVELSTCALHPKLDPNAQGDSLVDHLPARSREFLRWALNRLEQLEQSPDKSKAADAAEAAAELLLFFKGPEGKRPILPASFRPEGERESKQKIVDHLQRAVGLDPSRDRVWDCLTGLLIEMDKTEEAAAVCQKRIETKDSAHNRFLLAKVYAEKGQFDRTTEQLRAGLKREASDLDCRLGLAAVLLKRDDASSLKQAGEQLDAAEPRLKEEKGKEHETIYLLLRGIHAALNDRPREAKRLFEQVLGRDKGNTSAARGLAILGSQGGPPDEQTAVDYLRKLEGQIRHGSKSSGSRVVRVRLSGDKFTDEDLFFVTAFPSLRELDLFGKSFTDAGAIYLNQLASLRELSLSYTKITDAGLGRLEGLRTLEILRIDDNAFRAESPTITAAGLAHLRKLPNLRDVSVVSLTDRGLAELAAIPRLRRLHASFNKITDEGMSHLEGCRELRELEFFDGDFTDAGLIHLKKLPNLRVLSLNHTKITDAGLAEVKSLRNLRGLHLHKTKITDAGLVHLKELKKLEELDLSDAVITDAGLAHLRELTDLRDLDLSGGLSALAASMEAIATQFPGADPVPTKKPTSPRITGAGLKQLGRLTKLERLQLDGHPITDAGLAHLRGLSNLRWLFLDSCKITDAGMLTIDKLTRLERLTLDGAKITDAALIHLQGLKRLESVGLRGTKVTPEGIARLRKEHPKLDISH